MIQTIIFKYKIDTFKNKLKPPKPQVFENQHFEKKIKRNTSLMDLIFLIALLELQISKI